MAVVNTKATAITNADAVPAVASNRILTRGPMFAACGTVEVAAADDDGSVFRFARIPSNARVISIRRSNDAITGGTAYELGLHQTAGNGGAAADADLFGTTLDLSSAGAQVENRYEAADIANIEKRVWELLGLTSDPGRDYDVTLTGTTVGTAAGTISLEVVYTV